MEGQQEAEGSEVSVHLVRIYCCCLAGGWVTSAEVATRARVSPRTARHHLLRLVRLGILDQAEVFPRHRYRVSQLAGKRNKAFVQRLEKAQEVFGAEADL